MSKRRYQHASHDEMSWLRTFLLIGVAALLIWCIVIAYRQYAAAHTPAANEVEITNPGNLLSVITPDNIDETLIDYDYFIVNFNPALHIPNWVAWELTADETNGTLSRTKFLQDTEVSACPLPKDYTGSGYDRGHMAPAADMKWNADAMTRCFFMTNICPQAHSLNGGTWKKLEEKCRNWAQADSAIVIICGPILTPAPDEFIGETEVAVPHGFFKVILSPYANPPRGIAFIMPNGKIEGGLQAAAVSINEVEHVTGYDFFSSLPDDVEEALESECNFHYWSTLRK